MNNKPKTNLKAGITAGLIIFCIAFNLASWRSRGFSDWFTDNIYMKISAFYGGLTSLAPISVGEMMLIAFPVIVITLLVLTILRKRGAFSSLALFLAFVATLMSLNCFVLYHCTPFVVNEKTTDEYTFSDLAYLRDMIVTKCNEMAKEIPHDAGGNVIYDGDMKAVARSAMAGLSGEYKRLDGPYVTPKALLFSGFMSQQYMQGYYFPFSMEANYNDEMYIMNKPFTMCHELAHTHGYIYEDEANFLGFLACIKSDDPVFVYSGYLGVLWYVNNDFYDAAGKEEYKRHVKISDEVRYDSQFLTDEAWERVEDRAVLDTETVKQAADTFIDTNLKLNGIADGKVSYRRVVGLLLDYYIKKD